MADPPPYPDADDSGGGPERESANGTPRWVKVFGIIALVLVLLGVVLLLTGRGGEHGPGRHSFDGGAAHTTSSSVTAHAAQQPRR